MKFTVEEFRKALERGPYAWPGGYPLYFITNDGEALSFKAAQENAHRICTAIEDKDNTGGWRVVAVDVNWEDTDLYCAHSNEKIESAYGDDEPEDD